MGDVTDAGLLERAGKGDADAFSTLFARCQRAIYRYAVHMCGAEAGDDVVQDTFMAILRKSGRYDATRGSVASYLFGIARHMVIKTLSRDALDWQRSTNYHHGRTLGITRAPDSGRVETPRPADGDRRVSAHQHPTGRAVS